MKSEKKKADEFEEELQKEEKVLEGIRDSLKGMESICFQSIMLSFALRQDAGIS